ncbi:MAG: hypothetical protein FWD53_12615 [Phycisphaerales bacterium]|nr:hypothetical protein [Phycisphaerales bacterium]
MMQRLLQFLGVVSFFLFVLSFGLWVRTYFQEASFGHVVYSRGLWREIVSDYGGTFIDSAICIKYGDDSYFGIAPYIILVPVLAISSAIFFFAYPLRIALLQRRRHQQGLCVTCGYDLRGGHSRCPECGSATPGNSKG